MQVYKHLDIGSAKPTNEYVKKIPHHLISIIEPKEQFSVGDFVRESDKLASDIYRRGKIPVISGGTAFYFKNFIYGLPKLPTIDPEIRSQLNLDLKNNGLERLYQRLLELDPLAAKEINPKDTYRITRALEVFMESGKSILSFKQGSQPRNEYSFLIIGLKRDRTELYNRIDRRVDIMFEDGLLNEFKSLYSMGLAPNDPGMKGIGYSEFFQMMQAGCWKFEDLKDEIRKNSRRYAKRQITFFNSFSDVLWVDPDDIVTLKKIVSRFLSKSLE